MGIDLTLGIPKHETHDAPLVSERFRLDVRNYELFDALKEIATPLPQGADWYFEDGLETVTVDEYEDPLTFVTAAQMVKQYERFETGKIPEWDAAVMAFLRALRPDRKVILWWA